MSFTFSPVSILNSFSKIYERYMLNSLSCFVDKILPNFIEPYRKFNSLNHVLMRLIENWKEQLDKKT